MTTQPAPQCLYCKHWVSPLDRTDDDAQADEPTQVCTAYPLPGGIPDAVWRNQADHRQPYPGDNGVQFAPLPGEKFPDWALASARAGR